MLELSTPLPPSFRAVLKHDWFNEQGKCRKNDFKAGRASNKRVKCLAHNGGHRRKWNVKCAKTRVEVLF